MRVHKFIANCEQQTTTMSNAQQRTAKVRNARQRVPSRRWRCRSKYTRVGDVPAVHKLSDNTSVRPSSSSPCMWWGQAAGRQAARGEIRLTCALARFHEPATPSLHSHSCPPSRCPFFLCVHVRVVVLTHSFFSGPFLLPTVLGISAVACRSRSPTLNSI